MNTMIDNLNLWKIIEEKKTNQEYGYAEEKCILNEWHESFCAIWKCAVDSFAQQ